MRVEVKYWRFIAIKYKMVQVLHIQNLVCSVYRFYVSAVMTLCGSHSANLCYVSSRIVMYVVKLSFHWRYPY